jgi:hypothetical protein
MKNDYDHEWSISMHTTNLSWTGFTAFLLTCAMPSLTFALPPELQTSAPVIYLADNLDERNNLGWCIDTVGRGFGDKLHAHSCKPEGGDVQYYYDDESKRIMSSAFEGKCMDLSDPTDEYIPFGLLDCTTDTSQQFTYDAETMLISPESDESLCVSVAETSQPAGRYRKRALKLSACDETDNPFKEWIMLPR